MTSFSLFQSIHIDTTLYTDSDFHVSIVRFFKIAIFPVHQPYFHNFIETVIVLKSNLLWVLLCLIHDISEGVWNFWDSWKNAT